MGVLIFEKEIATSIPQDKLFKVFVLESDTIIPKIIPNLKFEFIEGSGGPGSIKKSTFTTEGGQTKYIKTQLGITDKENFTHSCTVIGGEPWMAELEKTTYDIKIVASPDGGSVAKSSSKFYPKEGCVLDEEKIKAGAEKNFDMFKAIEAHVLAHPNDF